MALKINPALKKKDLASQFQAKSRLQVENFLDPKDAEKVFEMVNSCRHFKFKYNEGDKEVFVKPMELKGMTERRLREFGNRIFNTAQKGQFQYTYYSCPLSRETLSENQKLKPFGEVLDFLDGKDMQNFLKTVTGEKVTGANAEVQWFKTDSFQTTGDGLHRREKRVLGYALEMTKDWNEDAGGVRFFKSKNGEVEDFYIPKFNSLTLFKVPMKNSISYITGYATGLKLSISGWFLAD